MFHTPKFMLPQSLKNITETEVTVFLIISGILFNIFLEEYLYGHIVII